MIQYKPGKVWKEGHTLQHFYIWSVKQVPISGKPVATSGRPGMMSLHARRVVPSAKTTPTNRDNPAKKLKPVNGQIIHLFKIYPCYKSDLYLTQSVTVLPDHHNISIQGNPVPCVVM